MKGKGECLAWLGIGRSRGVPVVDREGGVPGLARCQPWAVEGLGVDHGGRKVNRRRASALFASVYARDRMQCGCVLVGRHREKTTPRHYTSNR